MFQKSVNREIKSTQFTYFVGEFVKHLETLSYSKNTVSQAKRNISEFFAHLESLQVERLHQIQQNHVRSYIEYITHRPNQMKTGSLSQSYINKHFTTLRQFSKYLQTSELSELNIKPDLLKTTETATYLTKEEIKDLYTAAEDENNLYNQRDTTMLSLFYGCGLRASEGEALNVSDILFEKNLVYVRKGKNYRERYVPMNKQVKYDLKSYITDQRNELLQGNITEALLLGRDGKRCTTHGMYSRLRWLKKETNNDELQQKSFGLHILRHSIATHLLQSGMKLEYISHFLGHKSLETTQKYTHLVRIDY